MFSEDQLGDRLRARLRQEVAGIEPRADLLAGLRRRLARRSVTLRAGIGAVAVTAAAVTVAVMVAATGPVAPAHPPHHRAVAGASRPALPAREILLAAAVSAAKAPATGRYWVVADQQMRLQPAGTAAHPYDIADRSGTQAWYPRSAGQRYWYIVTEHGARPATPADKAAWRAVGSPVSWRFGGLRYGQAAQRFTMSPSPAQAYWQPRDQALGFLGSARATFARLQRLPSGEARLRAIIGRTAGVPLPRPGHVMTSAVASNIFGEGATFLTWPVTPQVRASIFKVIAGLPGVRSAGPMTDSRGRRGYGVEMPAGGEKEVIVVSPATGALLADELVVTTPGHTRVEQWASDCGLPHMLSLKGLSKAQKARVLKAMPSSAVCARLARDGSRYVQYGMRYQGQVTRYDLYTRVGWTNASPHLPAARFGPGSAKG
jgi:hypothetical protein